MWFKVHSTIRRYTYESTLDGPSTHNWAQRLPKANIKYIKTGRPLLSPANRHRDNENKKKSTRCPLLIERKYKKFPPYRVCVCLTVTDIEKRDGPDQTNTTKKICAPAVTHQFGSVVMRYGISFCRRLGKKKYSHTTRPYDPSISIREQKTTGQA